MTQDNSTLRSAWLRCTRMLTAFTVGAVTFVSAEAAAQSVSGSVTNSISGAPIADARVSLEGTSRSSYTDAAGRFQIRGVAQGSYTLVVQKVGIETVRRSVTVGATDLAGIQISAVAAPIIIPPVVVTATGEDERRRDATATIDALDGSDIRAARASHPSGIMNRLPGVHVSELSGEGHSTAIRQPITTKAVYLYLEDGIPTRSTGFFNHNALYEVNLPQAGGLEVLKGPGSALYGSDAVGGVINALTRPAPQTPGMEASVEGGSYGYRRLLLSGGGWFGGSGVRADLNFTDADGWRDNAPYRRFSGTVRWDAILGSNVTAKTIIAGATIDQFDVPSLNQTEFAGSRTLNKAPIAYRRVDALRVSTAIEKESGPMHWSVTPYARYNTMELLPQWQLTYDPQTWDTRNSSYGVVMRYRRDFDWWNARLVLGTDAEISPGSFKADGITPVRTDGIWRSYTFQEHDYDYDVTYQVVSPYVHGELNPLPGLRLDLGARYDASGYDYSTHLEPVATGQHRRPPSTSVSYSRLSPKFGMTYALNEQHSVFGSYREGFRTPSQGQVFQQGSAANTLDLKPVKVKSYELGVRGELGGRAVYSLSAYDMRAYDDILTFITAENTRQVVNAGETLHRGVEVGVGAALSSIVRLDLAYSRAEHEYVHWVPQESNDPEARVDYSGNDMESAPRDLANALITWTPPALNGGRLALEWRMLGKYARDAANTPEQISNGYTLVAANFNYQIRPSVELFARATNLLDERYAELESFDPFQQVTFNMGAPRSIHVGLKYGWQR